MNEPMMVVCDFCQCEYKTLPCRERKRAKKGSIKRYCSQNCFLKAQDPGRMPVPCSHCGKEKIITVTEFQKSKTRHFFCNRSCSAIFNNTDIGKVEYKQKQCACGKTINGNRMKCGICYRNDDFDERTLEESIYLRNDANRYSQIRERARRLYRDDIKNGCENCDFKLHAEVCHIKPIKDFALTDLLRQINARDNIKILCPNCHWVFDHGTI